MVWTAIYPPKNMFAVYHRNSDEGRFADDFQRFPTSPYKLAAIGISIELVEVSSVDDLPGDSEIRELIAGYGMESLPASEYDGVLVDSGEYHSDQILAYYLDASNGLLSADRTSIPAGNDMEFSCSVCFQR